MIKRIPILLVAVLALGGCATKEYVHVYVQKYVELELKPVKEHVGAVDARVERVESGLNATQGRVDAAEATLKAHDGRLGDLQASMAEVSKAVREALDRANAAGKLAEGRLMSEVVMTDDPLKFGSDTTKLTPDAMVLLDTFANQLKSENRNVYIEIQGHTDSRGSEEANLKVGLQRAEAVRRYLSMKGGVPLHRMSAISYGESQPVASNMYKDGRQQNRRVVLVVLH